ncbi:hypothetical protein S2E19_05003 [Bacillus mycoides]|nr:hypothetical protein S2E19_05003 [Bacillus mycoides]OSY12141.1 hypothetical protein BTJ48_01355 [Bacillus mycoides]
MPPALQTYIYNQNAHHWSQWHALHKLLDIRTHLFYKLFTGKQIHIDEMTESE